LISIYITSGSQSNPSSYQHAVQSLSQTVKHFHTRLRFSIIMTIQQLHTDNQSINQSKHISIAPYVASESEALRQTCLSQQNWWPTDWVYIITFYCSRPRAWLLLFLSCWCGGGARSPVHCTNRSL